MRFFRTQISAVKARLSFVLIWLAAAILCQGADAASSKPVTDSGADSKLPPLSWVPPEDDFDWVQLKSGEWLKGRLKGIQDRELEIESEELDTLTFEWKDIRQVRSSRTFDVLFADGSRFSGPIAVTPDQISVKDGGMAVRVNQRDQLQSITPGGSNRNNWSGSGSFGLTVRKGNTNQVEYNAQAHLERRTPETRFILDYIGNSSRIDGVESSNNTRVSGEFDYWLSKRFYLVLPSGEYYTDPYQNLTYRYTLGLGIGYTLIDRRDMEWNIDIGPAYQRVKYDSTQTDEPASEAVAALTFGSRFKWDITRRIDWTLEYSGQYTKEAVGETTHHGVSTLSIELTKVFDLDLSLTWDRINNPKVDANGVQPKQDDFRMVVSLGVDF